MEYPPVGSGDVGALDEDDGTRLPPNENGFCVLGVDTYLFPLGGGASPIHSVHIRTDATVEAVFTVETCNFPSYKDAGGSGAVDVSDFDTANVGNWVKEDPPTAYVATVGTGWAVTALTLTKTAGVGGATIHLGNIGTHRCRIKAVVTVGGQVRVNRWGKA